MCFIIRGVANAFDQDLGTDDGLRVAINRRNVEYLAWADRETGILMLDLKTTLATVADLSPFSDDVTRMIQ